MIAHAPTRIERPHAHLRASPSPLASGSEPPALPRRQPSQALEDADKCLSLAPAWAKGFSRRAAALVLLGKYKEAMRAYKQGLEIEPENAGLRSGLEELRASLRDGQVPTLDGGEGAAANGAAANGAAAKPQRERPKSALPVGQQWIEAAKRGDRSEMEELLREGGDELVHYKARGIGHTALHWAAARGECPLMRWLLSLGAQVNARNTSEATPLHSAAAQGQAFALSLLLASGADTSLLNDDGVSAAQLATSKSRPDLAREIEQHGAAGEPEAV